MATHKLENYLRTYRKRSGLTQREVAFLVGCRNGAQVSRYEKRRHLPPLRTALACGAAFGVSVSELFAGLREAAGKAVGERMLALKSKLETTPAQDRDARLVTQTHEQTRQPQESPGARCAPSQLRLRGF